MLLQRVVVQSEDGERVTFKKLLLNRCQEEFQKENSDSDDVDAMQKEIDEATSEVRTLSANVHVSLQPTVTV